MSHSTVLNTLMFNSLILKSRNIIWLTFPYGLMLNLWIMLGELNLQRQLLKKNILQINQDQGSPSSLIFFLIVFSSLLSFWLHAPCIQKNFVLLWTGKFKDLDQGTGDYVLSPQVWEAIGEATAASGSTIPSSYGPQPQNVAQDKSQINADSWSFWAMYLRLVLLWGHFRIPRYYTHFVNLVKLINSCLQFEITKEEIAQIQMGFQKWVETYERWAIHFVTLRSSINNKTDENLY